MAQVGPRSEAQLAVTRITGPRWCLAARDAEWDVFRSLSPEAPPRLLALLMRFCDLGEHDLPRGAFRWLSQTEHADGAAREGAFEAYGVVLRGRATDRVFFVTALEIDAAVTPISRRLQRRDKDPRQPMLPFLT